MTTTSTDKPSPVKSDRRHALVLAAYHAIAEKGFEGLRVRDVAAQVGINGATLHHYFPTKEDLIHGVVEYVIARLSETEEMEDNAAHPQQQLHLHLTRLSRLMKKEPELFVVLTEINLRLQRSPGAQFLAGHEKEWKNLLVGILQSGIEKGFWSGDLDPIATASVIIASVEGASMWAVMDPIRGEQVLNQLEKLLM